MTGLISFMLLALVLGFRHSYGSDHLIAVSNTLRKSDSVKSSAKAGLSWAMGHMLTATIITIILFIFKESFLNNILPHFEKAAGIMLILLGLISLKELFGFHSHRHSHHGMAHSHPHSHLNKNRHSHTHIFGIGLIHGLASNSELLILFTASFAVTSLGVLLAGLTVFSLGVVLGMVLFAVIFSYPLIKANGVKICRAVSFGTGSIGVLYGTLMLFAVV